MATEGYLEEALELDLTQLCPRADRSWGGFGETVQEIKVKLPT